jgi:hypothetical protein
VDEEAAFQAHHHQLQEQRRARGLRGVEVRDGRLVRARADDPAAPGSAGYSSLSDWAAFVFTGA